MANVARILLCFTTWSLIAAGDTGTTIRFGTVYMNGSSPHFRSGEMNKLKGAAYGFYNVSILQTGWGILEIHNGEQSGIMDNDRLFAAGYLEGVLTAYEIETNAKNMKAFWSNSLSSTKMNQVVNWMVKQDSWARQYVKNNSQTALARMTGNLLRQFDGMLQGVQDTLGSNRFSKADLLILVNTGDLIDLSNMFADEELDFEKMTAAERRQMIFLGGMCSALVKVTPGLENIFMSHVSWFTYSATTRIYKHYFFKFSDSGVSTGNISFSSYAGYLTSLDDFYILGSKMVMLQTTNNIFNKTLYDAVSPSSLMSWQRIRAANHMASNGKDWAKIVATLNSGTYNNQYMVIDLKKIHLKEHLDDGALTIVEQIPGLVEYSDQTRILANGHWPSYNVPFHERIYNLSGYPDFVQKYGVQFSYQLAPRAKLFRRDADKVSSFQDMQRLMRSNNYKHDPYSENDPSAAICARGDLITGKPRASGCYDGKVTDFAMAHRFEASIISGPTTAEGTLAPFSWEPAVFNKLPHEGLPQTYNFNWTMTKPVLLVDEQ